MDPTVLKSLLPHSVGILSVCTMICEHLQYVLVMDNKGENVKPAPFSRQRKDIVVSAHDGSKSSYQNIIL